MGPLLDLVHGARNNWTPRQRTAALLLLAALCSGLIPRSAAATPDFADAGQHDAAAPMQHPRQLLYTRAKASVPALQLSAQAVPALQLSAQALQQLNMLSRLRQGAPPAFTPDMLPVHMRPKPPPSTAPPAAAPAAPEKTAAPADSGSSRHKPRGNSQQQPGNAAMPGFGSMPGLGSGGFGSGGAGWGSFGSGGFGSIGLGSNRFASGGFGTGGFGTGGLGGGSSGMNGLQDLNQFGLNLPSGFMPKPGGSKAESTMPGLPSFPGSSGSGGLPGMSGGSMPGIGGGSSDSQPSTPEVEPGETVKNPIAAAGLTSHVILSHRLAMGRLYDPMACMGSTVGINSLRRHVSGIVASMLQRRAVEANIASGVMDCITETFTNTTIVLAMDVSYKPEDEAAVEKMVQYLTVDYGLEFCDYYGARCSSHQVDSLRIRRLPHVPEGTKLTWLSYKVPLPVEARSPPPSPRKTSEDEEDTDD